MADKAAQIKKLAETHSLRESILRSAIRTLKLPSGSRGLDAGCGIGLPALLLAEAIGPDGHVTGLDISPELLLHAQKIVNESGLSGQISFKEGDIHKLPFGDDSFDWVWSSDCAGYPSADKPLSLLKELARVVKPGGMVALLAWSSQQLLPGFPLLEARLNATCSAVIPYVKGKGPESIFSRALGWFQEIGLLEPEARTFVGDVQAPLSKEMRTALISLIEMLWGERQPGVSVQDWAEYQRLCLPESPDFILNLRDYCAFFTYSVFWGRVPG